MGVDIVIFRQTLQCRPQFQSKMPIGRNSAYMHGNVTPSFFHYQHIATAQGLKSKPFLQVDEKRGSKIKTFRQVRDQVFSSIPSFLETILYIFHGVVLVYGLTLFLKTKFASQVPHTEL